MKLLIWIGGILIFACSIGCIEDPKGTSTGNPVVALSSTASSADSSTVAHLRDYLLNFFVPKLIALPPPNSLSDRSGNAVMIQSFWTTIGDIEFKATEGASRLDNSAKNFEFSGPYSVDQLAENPQVLAFAKLTNYRIRRVEVKLKATLDLPLSAPAGLGKNSIYIDGMVENTSFSFSSAEQIQLSISGVRMIEARNSDTLLFQFRTANLIRNINLSTLINNPQDINGLNRVPAANPCPRIDPTAQDLYTCFVNGLSPATNFGRDNGDFELDARDDRIRD